jgi:hypothetical protein
MASCRLVELSTQKPDLIDQLSEHLRSHGLLTSEAFAVVQGVEPRVGKRRDSHLSRTYVPLDGSVKAFPKTRLRVIFPATGLAANAKALPA